VPAVSRLAVTPVKGLALSHPDEVVIERTGVAGNRRFFLVDERGRLFSGINHGALVRVVAEYDLERERLTLRFPDGRVVEGEIGLGDARFTGFWGRPVRGRFVEGPWNDAVSEYVGKPLRLIRADEPGGGYDVHPVSLLGDASVDELGRQAGRDAVDERRFRMLIGIAGTRPHEEDEWIGRRVRVGEAVVRIAEPNSRCATTTQNPESGARDFDTLRAIKAYRGLRDGKKIDFGVYADVEEPGRAAVGDPVEPLD
jgi:uncharacterized protein YcbX